jgi:phage host-nuclease inhibitor protein Gam
MRPRLKKSLTLVPASLVEATRFIASIITKQLEINRLNREAKEKTEQIKKDLEQSLRPLVVERDAFFNSLFAFAKSKQKELTTQARSIKTDSGVFGWRWTTPKVEVSGDEDRLIARMLKDDGLAGYVRITYELNREAMLADRPEIDGVSYTQREEFFVTPKLPKGAGKTETVAIDV